MIIHLISATFILFMFVKYYISTNLKRIHACVKKIYFIVVKKKLNIQFGRRPW